MYHPLPTAPGALLGYRRNGQPFYLIAGGSGEGDGGQGGAGQNGADQNGGTNAGDGTANNGQQQGQSDGQNPPNNGQNANNGQNNNGQGDGEGDVKSLPEWAQKVIRDTRAEAASNRTNAKTQAAEQARQDLAQQIGKALGLVKDDTPADPAQLASQIGDLTSDNKSLKTELAVFKAAAKVGADAGKLTDSRSFLATLDKLDPTADGFDAKLRDAIKAAVDDNPQYRIGQAPAASGGTEPSGRPGASGKPANLTDAITARMSKGT